MMSFLSPAALWALLAIPVIVALHLFRRKLRDRKVAGLFLFSALTQSALSGRRRSRISERASLLCEIVAGGALALWLAGLSFGGEERRSHVVIVLDDSASMGATGPDGGVPERARKAVAELMDQAEGTATATLILTGPRPAVVAGPRADSDLIGRALVRWSPRKRSHDPAPAFDLAQDLAAPEDRIVFVTDDPAAATPGRMGLRAVGAPRDNVAITSARRGADGRVEIDATNYGRSAATRRLQVSKAGGGSLAGRSLEIPAGASAHVTVEGVAEGDALEVAIDGDALAIDDRIAIVTDAAEPVAVSNLLPDDASRALQMGRVLASVRGTVVVDDPDRASLVISGSAERQRRGVTELVIAAAGTARSDWVGPFLIDRRHPLTDGLTLDGVVWSAGGPVAGGAPLIVAGDVPLLVEQRSGRSARVVLNLDPSRSNLADSPDWPILVSNVVDLAREAAPGAERKNVRLGESIVWRRDAADPPPARFELELPSGERQRGSGSEDLVFETREPGLHRLRREGGSIAEFAVQFADARESDLRDRGEARRDPPDEPGTSLARASGTIEARVLALLALLAVVANWLILRRAGSS